MDNTGRLGLNRKLQKPFIYKISPASWGSFRQVKKKKKQKQKVGLSSQCLKSVYSLLENEDVKSEHLDIAFTAKFYSQTSRANHTLLTHGFLHLPMQI